MKVTVTHDITPQRIADLMITAIESGSSRYWCDGVYWRSVDVDPPRGVNGDPWYANPAIYEHPDLLLEIHDAEEAKAYYVRLADIEEGLAIIAEKYPEHMMDILGESWDGVTGDVFLQCITLKDIIYG